MKNNVTINDIAKMANVSKTTVSFILNNKDGISEQTRQRVMSVIEQTNYKPAKNSKRLFFQKNYTLAVVFDKSVPVLDNLFYYGILNALMKQCMHYDYSLVYSEYSLEGEQLSLPQHILDKDVDGLIFLKDIPLPLITKLHELEIPFVVVDDHSEHSGLHTVKADYRLAAYTAVSHLLEQGHRRIGFLGNKALPAFFTQVFSGFQSALKEAGLPLELEWYFDDIRNQKALDRVLSTVCLAENRPTAFFCIEDNLAIMLIRQLQKGGWRVPEDFSVIAIDDLIISSQIYPALTTVAVDKEEMGTRAVDMLMDLLENKKTESVTISSNNLVIRESVKKI